ncbi:MAG: SDR family oxidoreductase [Sumerlaeia bacterium]
MIPIDGHHGIGSTLQGNVTGRLAGKTALVTGGGTGIGEAIAHKFAYEGAAVLVAGLPGDPVEDVAECIRRAGGMAESFEGDLADPARAEACVDRAVQAFGKLDILVNNAGVYQTTGATEDFPVEDFDRMFRDNVRSAFLMTKYALPYLQSAQGNVIATGSEAGELGMPKSSPYGGTKGFVHAFIRGVAAEQAPHGVRANCVCCGPMDTQWHQVEESATTKEMEKGTLQAVVMGRRGNPEEAANVFAFVASDEASFMTGSLVYVDGGISISRGDMGSQIPEPMRQTPEGRFPLRAHEKEGNEGKTMTKL